MKLPNRRLPVAIALLARRLAVSLWLGVSMWVALQGDVARADDSPDPPPDFDFHVPAGPDDPAIAEAMRDLADRILPVYEESEKDRYLTNVSALQLVSGNYQAADDSRRSLRERRAAANVQASGRTLLIDLYAHAKAVEATGGMPFSQAFTQAFRELVPKLSNLDAYAVTAWVGTPLAAFHESLQRALDQQRDDDGVTLDEAIHLMWTYLAFEAYRSFGAQLETLGNEDDRRRYAIDEDVAIPVAGAKLHARVVRPKGDAKLPTLLEFGLFPAANDAKACAAHGYAGVVAYVRGKDATGKAVGEVKPFDREGEDARALIGWIAKQPWSDGSVGMYGSTFAGYTTWAAARRAPAALKAIATIDAMAPGVSFPMEGNIFRNGALRWALANTVGKAGAGKSGRGEQRFDDAQWRELGKRWYESGKPYRELEPVIKQPSAIFHGWLGHPSYDRWWQRLIPFREGFKQVKLPVLAMAGSYGNAEIGSLYYFEQHRRYAKDPDHTLVLGAYDDSTMLDGPSATSRGLAADPVAHLDLRELRFQWFDHVLKGKAKPALLSDRVNYEVAGANQWLHAQSIETMANGAIVFHLDGSARRLIATKTGDAPFELTVDFKDRSDAGAVPTTEAITKALPARHGLTFLSEPLPQPIQIAGLLSGTLDFKPNKADVDFYLGLYELTREGDYIELADPYEFRASYATDRTQRKMLKVGKRQQLRFQSEQIVLRRLAAGSRIAVVLGINKRPDREINYGSGKAVRDESIADAKVPLKIQFYAASTVDVPVRR